MEIEGERKEEVRDEAAIIDEILAELDAEGAGITFEFIPELEMGHWQVNGIDILVRDSLLQGAVIDEKAVRSMWVDVVVKPPEKEAFMKLMQSNLNEGGYLTFTRGKTTVEASLEKMVYSSSSSGYNVRLDIDMKGYEYKNRNLKGERIKKVKDVWKYVEGEGSSIKGVKSFFNQ
ncbi:hypothetical protein [Planococcus donghaensis]|uniref:hypothetical protein n=1 Tax=Planococcus donghaensis TaxID=414778 RepID=UPI003736AD03